MKLNDKTYDILKWIALVLLPGVSTLYFALAGIWGLPFAEQIVGTISAIDTFLGVLLGISSVSYYKDSAKNTVDNVNPVNSEDNENN